MNQPTLDTFLVTAYTILDDLCITLLPKRTRGRPPEVSDSEVLTLSLMQQLLFPTSESRFLRFAAIYWRSFFPRQLSQSAFNKRVRALEPFLPQIALQPAIQALKLLKKPSLYELIDGFGVPLMNRERSRSSSLFGAEADIGRAGVPREFYYGFKVVIAAHPAGPITGWVVGPASTEERWLLEGLLRWRAHPQAPAPNDKELGKMLAWRHRPKYPGEKGPKGPLDARGVGERTSEYAAYLCDSGYEGKNWLERWKTTFEVAVLPPSKLGDVDGKKTLKGTRQRVEQVIGALGLGEKLRKLAARSECGARARLSVRMLAHNLRCLLNAMWQRPTLSILDPIALHMSSF